MIVRLRRWFRWLPERGAAPDHEPRDPQRELEGAIADAREQHRLLAEQAAAVIANEIQVRARLERALGEYEQATGAAGSALLRADEERQAGHTAEAAAWDEAAAAHASRVIALEAEIDDLRSLLGEASRASEQAREAVQQSAETVRRRTIELDRAMGRLDQARLQEQVNESLRQQLEPGASADQIASLDRQISQRLAAAQAMSDLRVGPDAESMEVDRALRHIETEARLDTMRRRLNLDAVHGPTDDKPEVPSPPSPDTGAVPGAR